MTTNTALSDVVWADIMGYVRTRHDAVSRGWFSQLQASRLDRGELTILVGDTGQLAYLNQHCVPAFVEAAQDATGRLVTVRFVLGDAHSADRPGGPGTHGGGTALLGRHGDCGASPHRLNADYLFDNFVVGPCNRLAHASCLAISDSPGTTYNPLFIHGSVGLGKTHLLHAVCHRIREQAPAARILYLSSETFVNHFIEAVEKGALDGFRYRYRHVDLLLIDDIQFLAGRDQTQEEFFHTFNTLYQLQKQIVLSADCSPAEIPSLEERLVSRFNWGLVARIDAPCLETRLAIIHKKMTMRGMEIPEDVALLIASRIKSNSRELEGALNRVHGLAQLDGRRIDAALARQALGDEEGPASRQIKIQDIMQLVIEGFGVKLSDLQGRRRSRCIALPRQVGMYLARQYTEHSLGEIGGFFGGRDHTTVLYANKLITRRRQADVAFRSRLEELEASLQGH